MKQRISCFSHLVGYLFYYGFPSQTRIMDFLPLDGFGLVPKVNFRTIRNDLWVGLNTSCDVIPSEAPAYIDHQSKQWIVDNFRAKGPTGLYLEMEWALDADCYNLNTGWRPFMPLPSGDTKKWYYQMDQHTPPDPASKSPHYTIFPLLLMAIEDDLQLLESCMISIATSSIFPDKP